MKNFKLTLITFTITAFLMGCSTAQNEDAAYVPPYRADVTENEINDGDNAYLARENLDLQAVGNLLEKSNNAEEFEYLLNSRKGVNNLDLNSDGYVDYISVSEYEDRDTNQRGFKLFDRFSLNDIQEIASIFFDRDRYDNRGARILLNGNEQVYGDNYYYETNWLDQNSGITDWIFSDRQTYYQSPYYYDNYPSNYVVYQVIETPVYRTRIQEYYPVPVFIQTVTPTITQIRIKSPYDGRSSDKIFAKLAKPTKEQKEFRKNNPNRPEFVPVKNGKTKDDAVKNNDKKNTYDFEKSGKVNNDRLEIRKNSDKPNKIKQENVKQNQPNKVQRENVKQNQPNKVQRENVKQNKPNNESKPNGGGKGNGKGKKN